MALISDGLAAGGAERQCALTASVLVQNGHDAEIIYYRDVNDLQTMLLKNRVPSLFIRPFGGRLGMLFALAADLRGRRFDVVHAFKGTSSIYGRAAALLARTPRIFGGYRAQIRQDRFSAYANSVLNMGTCGWIVNSEGIKRRMCDLFRVPSHRVYVVRNAIDPEAFESNLSASEAKARFGIDSSRLVVGMIANHRPMKNHDVLFWGGGAPGGLQGAAAHLHSRWSGAAPVGR